VVCTDNGLSSIDNRKFNDRDEDNEWVKKGVIGQRHFVVVQSLKKMDKTLQDWALGQEGWSYRTKDSSGKRITVNNFSLTKLNNDNYGEFRNVTFFKERTAAENGLDQRLIATFSLKYKEYMQALRKGKIDRAEKMIKNGTYKKQNDSSPRSLIKESHTTEDGQEATVRKADIDKEKIDKDSRFDGFYCLATNMFKDKYPIELIAKIGARRWEIEECFRIMKSDFNARPFFHNKDSRIKAHLMTCFMALMLIRTIERQIAANSGAHPRYPDGKYTVSEILTALREIKVIRLDGGRGYQPDYTDSPVIKDLLEIFDLKELEKEVIFADKFKEILKRIKKAPRKYKSQGTP